VSGYILPDLLDEFGPQFFAEAPLLLAQGKLKCEERIIESMEAAPQALVDTLTGHEDIGKPVVIIARE
jgi:NADPH-dependent curcumin reductase CurA